MWLMYCTALLGQWGETCLSLGELESGKDERGASWWLGKEGEKKRKKRKGRREFVGRLRHYSITMVKGNFEDRSRTTW